MYHIFWREVRNLWVHFDEIVGPSFDEVLPFLLGHAIDGFCQQILELTQVHTPANTHREDGT
jgi:hypothetical protein